MVNQSITTRNTAEIVVEQGTPGSVVQQLAEQKLAQLRALALLGQVESDLAYIQMSAYVALPGRSPTHQRRVENVAGHLLAGHDVALDRVISDAQRDIISNRPEVVVRTVTKYSDPPRKPLLQRIIG